jgi:hypothetical protein
MVDKINEGAACKQGQCHSGKHGGGNDQEPKGSADG